MIREMKRGRGEEDRKSVRTKEEKDKRKRKKS